MRTFVLALIGSFAVTGPLAAAGPRSETLEQREKQAARDIREAQNLFLSGSRQGRAEWPAVAANTVCGVTPEGRYLIARTGKGPVREDEPPIYPSATFNKRWSDAKCADNSPVEQQWKVKVEEAQIERLRGKGQEREDFCAKAGALYLSLSLSGDTVAAEQLRRETRRCRR